MTVVDFNRPEARSKEVPDGIRPSSKYKPIGDEDTVVIDCGSYQYRAGFASKDLPSCITLPHVLNNYILTIIACF